MDRFQECGCGCGRIIELVNWDSGGADYTQPAGFYDDSCMRWYSNECGNPKKRLCEGCLAYQGAQELIALAITIRDRLSVSNEDPQAALNALREMIAVEQPLGRRLRRMATRKQKPSTESCDPKTCIECLRGAA